MITQGMKIPDGGINYAAIDIGSNAVRLLIKHVEEDINGVPHFSKVLLLRVPLRLGFDVFAMGKISEKKEKDMMVNEILPPSDENIRCRQLPRLRYLGHEGC